MKKVLMILTVLSVMGVVLAGCSGGGDTKADTSATPAKGGTDTTAPAAK